VEATGEKDSIRFSHQALKDIFAYLVSFLPDRIKFSLNQ